MQIVKEIRVGRLLLALGITLLIADTIPHPSLSAGLLESSLYRVQAELAGEKNQAAGAIAESGR
jgi:hypothetical protein